MSKALRKHESHSQHEVVWKDLNTSGEVCCKAPPTGGVRWCRVFSTSPHREAKWRGNSYPVKHDTLYFWWRIKQSQVEDGWKMEWESGKRDEDCDVRAVFMGDGGRSRSISIRTKLWTSISPKQAYSYTNHCYSNINYKKFINRVHYELIQVKLGEPDRRQRDGVSMVTVGLTTSVCQYLILIMVFWQDASPTDFITLWVNIKLEHFYILLWGIYMSMFCTLISASASWKQIITAWIDC